MSSLFSGLGTLARDVVKQVRAAVVGKSKVVLQDIEATLNHVWNLRGYEEVEFVGFERATGREKRILIKEYTTNHNRTGHARYRVVWEDRKRGPQDQWLDLMQLRGLLRAYDPRFRSTHLKHEPKRTHSTPDSTDAVVQLALGQAQPVLVMMMGLPGSGKSTYGRKIAMALDAVYLATDDIRAELFGDTWSEEQHGALYKEIMKRVKAALAKERHVIVDGTHLTSKRRYGFLKQVRSQVPKVCCFIDTPAQECRTRNAARPKQQQVPEEYMQRYLANLQPPVADEGWAAIHVVRHADEAPSPGENQSSLSLDLHVMTGEQLRRFLLHRGGEVGRDEVLSRIEWLEGSLYPSSPWEEFLVAAYHGEVVGVLCWGEYGHGQKHHSISYISVDSRYWRSGVATRLIHFFGQQLQQQQITEMRVSTMQDMGALINIRDICRRLLAPYGVNVR